MEQTYTPKQDYKVLVRCFTYNQSKYIEDALNGFAMQQTNFPFVCLVMDDCSTDGEQEVIKKWMERECDMTMTEIVDLELSILVHVPHKSNKNCAFAFYLLKRNLYREVQLKWDLVNPWRDHSKYEAICEGDDYWIAPNKLQRQGDWLDTHDDFVMVAARHKAYIQRKNQLVTYKQRPDTEIVFEDLFCKEGIVTLTTMFRMNVLKSYHKEITKQWLMADYPKWLYFSKQGRIMILSDVVGVYRELQNSASHFSDPKAAYEFKKSSMDITYFFIGKYGISPEILKIVDQKTSDDLYSRGLHAQSIDLMDLCISFRREHNICVGIRPRIYRFVFRFDIGRGVVRNWLRFKQFAKITIKKMLYMQD